jgi:HprK-related kinase A
VTRTISDLSESDVDRFLRGEGLCLRTGPFLYRIKSDVPKLASAIRLLYADFAIPQRDSESLVDYHVSVRRWFMGNCRFGLLGSFTSQPLPLSCAFAALEWGLNTCIYNEGQLLLLLHAAVVEREGEALLLVGESGSGKSTLCAALTLSGWRLLSDELAMIATSDGNLSATARPIILKNESISVIRRFSERAVLGPIAHSKARGTVAHLRPPRASIERMDDRALAS